MKIKCDDEIFEMFPEASFHAVALDTLKTPPEETIADWKRRAAESVAASGIKPELLVEHPAIKEWRNAFSKFGLKPSKFRSSIEQLYKRALKGDLLETRLPLVNLYCYLSVLHLIPAGGYDLDKIEGDAITVRPAIEGEQFRAIGERDALPCQPGAVCYADAGGVICYGWNWRDAARTCLDERTTRAIFFADSAADASRRRAERAIADLAAALNANGSVSISQFVLDAQNREIVF